MKKGHTSIMIKKPMKGDALEDLSLVRFPVLASPKIDGFRCVLGAQAYTSRLSSFPNKSVHEALSGLMTDDAPLDGEIVVGKRRGPGVLQRTSSGVTSRAGDPDWRLWIFDAPREGVGKLNRLKLAAKAVKSLGNKRIRFIKHEVIHSLSELEEYIEACLKAGFEGIMISDPDGPYKEGRSTIREGWLLKIKPFEDAEGRVIGWFEEQENTNEAKREATGKLKRSSAKAGKIAKGQLGGFILEDCKTRIEVRVGGGFTHHQRKNIWQDIQSGAVDYKGTLVRYKKQSVGEKDKPRHPNFLEFVDLRPEWDFTD